MFSDVNFRPRHSSLPKKTAMTAPNGEIPTRNLTTATAWDQKGVQILPRLPRYLRNPVFKA